MDTALILAGGESARFGRPKALVDIGGNPMIRWVIDAVTPLGDEVVVSVANSRMADRIRPIAPQARFVVDRREGVGPIEGIARGFETARGERVIVAPCDAPLLRSELYRLLLEVLGEFDAAVPRLEAIDPVRAVYQRRRVLEVLNRSRGIPSPSALVDRLRCRFVDADRIRAVDPDLTSFWDVNNPADLDRVRQELAARDPGTSS